MRQRDRISAAVGVSALGIAVFALGGAPRWSVVLLALLAAGGVAAQLRSRRCFDRPSPMLVMLAIAAGLTALQCIPLPGALLASLNPTAHELIADGAVLAGRDGAPSWLPLSLDAPNTRRALLELATYLALAWLALRFTASELGRRRLAAATVLVISAAAVVGLLHEIGPATRLYGFYTLHHAERPLIMGPLVNVNSYGGLLAMGAILAAGLALHGTQTQRQRLFWGSLGVISFAVCLLTQSRGAAVALAVGLAVFGGVVAVQRWRAQKNSRRKPELLRVTVPAIFVVASVLALVVFMSAGGVAQQLGETTTDELSKPLSKFEAWSSAAKLIHESPWVGVGRGGFESTFTRVHPDSAYTIFSRVENAYLQIVLDWGIPGALIVAMAFAWMVLVVARRWSGGPMAAGAIGALAAIAVQSTVDLGLELPGVAVPVIAITALLTYSPVIEAPSRTLPRHILWRGAGIAALLAMAVLVAVPWGRTLADDHELLIERSNQTTLADAQHIMRRHPMDYVAPAEGARALLRAGKTTEGTALLNHALMLHPTHPDLHLWAARALVLGGKARQAQLEYVMAIRGRRNPRVLVKEVVAAYSTAADAAGALPLDDQNTAFIGLILADLGRNDIALIFLERVTNVDPLDAKVYELLTRVAEQQHDDDTAERAARRRAAITPTLSARLALGRILQRRGKLKEAETALHDIERAGGSADEQINARLLLCDVYFGLQEFEPSRECLRALIGVPALQIRTRRDIHRRLAKIEDALGNPRRALFERKEAER